MRINEVASRWGRKTVLWLAVALLHKCGLGWPIVLPEAHPEALAAKRESLDITQKDMATLLDSSALSVWKWETGKATPRAAQLERIRAVLNLGKREALAKLTG